VPRLVAYFALASLVVLVGAGAAAAPAAQPGGDVAPQVSPDGRWLLFERLYGGSRYSGPDTSLRIARLDGSGERELVPRRRALQALWTPENLIQVTLDDETTLRRPEDGSVVRRLAFSPQAWSPDGRWVAYVEGTRYLYVAAPDGSRARRIADAGNLGVARVGEFSPNSSRLTYALHPALRPDRSEVVEVDGTGRRELRRAGLVSAGQWSPDGGALVFVAQADSRHYRPPRVWVVSADGSNAHPIAPGFAAAPDWSPFGDWIVYLRQRSTPMADIYELMIARPTGAGRRRVVRTNQADAIWLPDGRRLLSVGYGACRRAGIIEIDAFARTVKRLTNRCRIAGTPGDDVLRGTPLRDLIDGRGGDDSIIGGGGDDRLSGGDGDDTIRSRDRFRDTVRCGPGADGVIADRRDYVARDCERVRGR
jgi:RTX calcium-binding nonapeptide repeat (4 copies)/WD40-like Beta Propeller Repeat